MQRLIAWYRDATQLEEGSHIAPLDGVRFLMVFVVASFHIWQQSWLTPALTLFGQAYSLDFLLRSGYLWVDGMLLLSGFLLYLPYAQSQEKGAPSPAILPFYRKRLVRIVPSYYLAILVMLLFVALPYQMYRGSGDMAKDVLAHLTFTHTLFPFSYHATPLNGALWTLGVEMHFYLIFPFLARAFRRQPLLTYAGMAGAAFLFRGYAVSLPDNSMWFNQMPAFLDVYANGFVAAACYTSLRKRMKEDSWTRILMTVCAAAALYILLQYASGQAAENGTAAIRLGQLKRRYGLSVFLSLFMLGVSLGLGGIRLVLGNRVTRILSEISFQFYIWHQVFAVQLKRWGFPPSQSLSPHQAGEKPWQYAYVACCYLGALAISVLVTYLFERPIAKRLTGK